MNRLTVLMCVLALGLGCCIASAYTVDTGSWDKTTGGDFGPGPGIATVATGQQFLAPDSDPFLDGFSIDVKIPDTFTFHVEVYAWADVLDNPIRVVVRGPELWDSGPITTLNPDQWTAITFHPNVELTGGSPWVYNGVPGKMYLIVVDPFTGTGTGAGKLGVITHYPGPFFDWINGNPDFYHYGWWENDGSRLALAMSATFDSQAGPELGTQQKNLPEPCTMALLAMGLVGIVAKRRKK